MVNMSACYFIDCKNHYFKDGRKKTPKENFASFQGRCRLLDNVCTKRDWNHHGCIIPEGCLNKTIHLVYGNVMLKLNCDCWKKENKENNERI